MDINAIAQLVSLMERSTLVALEAEQDGLRVRLEAKNKAHYQEEKYTAAECDQPVLAPQQAGENIVATPDSATPVDTAGTKEVRSPMVGTFHALKDGKSAIGSKLKKGEPVCVIEAMKLMNEILMEENGEIVWTAVTEDDIVEYDQLLFLYK